MDRLKRSRGSKREARQQRNFLDIRRAAKRGLKLRSPLSEARLCRLINESVERKLCPPWIFMARLANPDEDHRGIDLIIDTDKKPLFLQVKTSDVFKRVFNRRRELFQAHGRHCLHIGVIIVHDGRRDGEILRDTWHVLQDLRQQVDRHGIFIPPNGHHTPG